MSCSLPPHSSFVELATYLRENIVLSRRSFSPLLFIYPRTMDRYTIFDQVYFVQPLYPRCQSRCVTYNQFHYVTEIIDTCMSKNSCSLSFISPSLRLLERLLINMYWVQYSSCEPQYDAVRTMNIVPSTCLLEVFLALPIVIGYVMLCYVVIHRSRSVNWRRQSLRFSIRHYKNLTLLLLLLLLL